MASDLVVIQASDLQQLNFLHQGSTRLKVVCFDLCSSSIVLGANSGTIYVLDHETLNLKNQIPTENGSVVQLSISPDESLVACALSSGTVDIFELASQGGGGSRHLVRSREHEGHTVSSVAWTHSCSEVYIGDSSGRVSVLYIPKSKTVSLFRSCCSHLMTLESGVTQLDYSDGYLLVSTLTRSFICNTSLETFMQIGTKLRQGEYGGCFCRVNPSSSTGSNAQATCSTGSAHQELDESLDDSQSITQPLSGLETSELSDCFEAVEVDQADESTKPCQENQSGGLTVSLTSRIFCARPGTRIWEADHSGKVLVTHQLKRALMVPPAEVLFTDGSFGEQELLEELDKTPSTKALASCSQYMNQKNGNIPQTETLEKPYGSSNYNTALSAVSHPPVSVAFTKLISFYSNYLLAISTYGLYVIDPANSKVLLWISVSDSVIDVKVSGNTLIYKTGNGCIQNFMITTVDIAILVLHTRGLHVVCAQLCLQYKEVFLNSELLSRLGAKILTDISNQIISKVIQERLQNLKTYAGLDKVNAKQSSSYLLKSGVTCIRNDCFEDGKIREGLHSFIFGPRMFLPASVTRWYSDPYLRRGREENTVHRCTVSVEGSPLHHALGDKNLGHNTTYVQDIQSPISLSHMCHEDAVQSKPSGKFIYGFSTASPSTDKKCSSPEHYLGVNSPSLSSGRCSQHSDHRSHKSFESSIEMYEDPLFSSDTSSPDLEMASRIFLDSNQSSNCSYDSHIYNLTYAPIHPGSEAANLLQDLMENVATNMVDTITSGTKNLTERLKSVTPLISSGDGASRKSVDEPFSILDIFGSDSNTDQEDQLQSSTSGEIGQMDDLNTSIVIKTKSRKKHTQNNTGTIQLMYKPANVPPGEEITRSSVELPGVVKNLHELVTSTFQQIINTDDEAEARILLTHWLKVYFSTVQQIQPNKRLSRQASEETPADGPVSLSSVDSSHSHGSGRTSCDSLYWDSSDIGFEPSAMSADIHEQITELFLQCFHAGVCIDDIYNAKVAPNLHKHDNMQHPVTPEAIQKIDTLYAYLISSDCGLLHYSNLLNALDTLGQHYYIMTWAALLEKVTSDTNGLSNHPLPSIIPNLDFTRSQRVSILYRLASAGNMRNFITAAAQIDNPAVITDVIYILNHFVARSLEIGCASSKSEFQKHFLQFLIELSQHKNLMQLYLNYWISCPEIQYDILSALLNTDNPSTFSCSCGMPLPCCRPVMLEYLVDAIVDHDILDAKNLSELCQNLGYWKGYCSIILAYNLRSNSQCFPFILQSCNLHLLDDIMEVLQADEFVMIFDTLASMTSEDNFVMKCYKCHSKINFPVEEVNNIVEKQKQFEYKFQVNGEPHYTKLNAEDFDKAEASFSASKYINGHIEEQMVHPGMSSNESVFNMGELWEAVVAQVLRRVGAVETLRLLSLVQDKIPPGILTERVYSWCILISLAEKKGPAACWCLLDTLTCTRRKCYSHKVAKALHRHDAINNRPNKETGELSKCSLEVDKNDGLQNEPKMDENGDDPVPPKSSMRGVRKPPRPLGHHWGVQTQVLQGLCFCCHLRLPTHALVVEGGITVFPCSHAFHTICLSHRGHHCVICAQNGSQHF